MNLDVKKMWPAAAMSIVALTTMLSAANSKSGNKCPAKDMGGPDREINPSVRPMTADACCCDEGEFVLTGSALYWTAQQDGMEYAVLNKLGNDQYQGTLIDAKYLNPDFKWNWGLKLGIGYNIPHDGWDVGAVWTHFRGRASSHDDSDSEDNETLLPLWSAFAPATTNPAGGPNTRGMLYANEIDTSWKVTLDLVDIELGREFWTSKYLTLRPFMGVRIGWIRQEFDLDHSGGTWGSTPAFNTTALNNYVSISNDFTGAGLRGGLNGTWYFTKGWGLIGNVALSVLYGRFSVDHDEYNRLAESPFSKTHVVDTKDSFRACRAIADMLLGIQYSTMFREETFGFMISLAWEQHVFFNQNQMWRVNRVGDATATEDAATAGLGENVFMQRRGDLTTQGVTLTATLVF